MVSSSKSSQKTSQTDNRRVLGDGAISAENSTVNVLDGNAINQAFDMGKLTVTNALNFGDTALNRALNFSLNSNAQALDSLNTTAELVKGAYEDAKGRGAMTDQILIGSVVMAGLVAMAALKKG